LLEDIGELGVEGDRLGCGVELVEFTKGFFPGRGGFQNAGSPKKIDDGGNEEKSGKNPIPSLCFGFFFRIFLRFFFGLFLSQKRFGVVGIFRDFIRSDDAEWGEGQGDGVG